MKKRSILFAFGLVLKGIFIFIFFTFNTTLLQANQGIKTVTTKRFALIIGANDGGPERMKLRYAVSDAESFTRLLEDMGGVGRDECILLSEPDRQTFFLEMKKIQRRIKDARPVYRRVEAVFYYSGHSDEKNILLGKEKVSYQEFRDAINRMDADVHIAILDSCASGAFTQLKGGKKRTPFLIDSAYNMKGYAFMTSSSSDEASQESDRLKGSFFTHYLISGMRGAADVTQDGKVTLSEAYQYAFNETLSQTEKTMSGPQHPNYNIRMSGTGDVVMTDIRRSSAVLIIDEKVSGRIFIHNRENVLVVEINKAYGRTIEIGLEEGEYRIINIREGEVYEAKVALQKGESIELTKEKLKKTDKLPTKPRGDIAPRVREEIAKKRKKRFQVELYGGFSTMVPADLNLRAESDKKFEEFYYEDYFNYQGKNGKILFWNKVVEGELKTIKNAFPIGFRFKFYLSKRVAFSLGLKYVSKEQTFEFINQFLIQDPYWQYQEKSKYSPYTLSAEGFAPMIGIHLGKQLSDSMEVEGFLSIGPLLARCGYTFECHQEQLSVDGTILYKSTYWFVDERGKGTGFALDGGVRINKAIGNNMLMFIEGGYASQVVKKLSGPGREVYGDEVKTWEGRWGIKEYTWSEEWGDFTSRFPSNFWDEEGLVRVRDFKLDLSGFFLRIGISLRF